MKAERVVIEKKFVPIEVKLTIETKEELTAFKQFATLNVSIPKVIREEYGDDARPNIVKNILNIISKA